MDFDLKMDFDSFDFEPIPRRNGFQGTDRFRADEPVDKHAKGNERKIRDALHM